MTRKKFCISLFTFIFFVILTGSLLSYNRQDPSWNTISDVSPTNLFGWGGATIADLFMQLFGVSSYFIAGYGLYLYAVKFIYKKLPFLKLHLLSACLFVFVFSSFLKTLNIINGIDGQQTFSEAGLFAFPVRGVWKEAFLFGSLTFVLFITSVLFFVPFSYKMPDILKRFIPEKKEKPVEKEPVTTEIVEKSVFRKRSKKKKEEKKIVQETKPSRIHLPDSSLLKEPSKNKVGIDQATLEATAQKLNKIFSEFHISGNIVHYQPGPVVTLFELEIAPGIQASRVIRLTVDVAREMQVSSVRIAVIPGSSHIGIEVPNPERETVWLKELIDADEFKHTKGALPLVLGQDIGGNSVFANLASMPHLLVAGTTGSGKSVAINTMILSLLYRFSPDECRFIMIDPKMLELSVYNGIPHLLIPVVTESSKAVMALNWAVREMEDRYRNMSNLGVRNIEGYNAQIAKALKDGATLTRPIQTGFDQDTGNPIIENEEIPLKPLPYIVIIVDEMADLMLVSGKEVEAAIQRLAQMARAAGIHLIMATQRPSVDVITGTIKSNFPTRISFHLTTQIDSRTILGEQGAEQLLGKGDMLYLESGKRPRRVHGPFVSDEEIEKVVKFWKKQQAAEYIDSITEELNPSSADMPTGFSDESNELYDQAVNLVLREQKVSTSYVQRCFHIGYNRAADLIDRMEKEGVITAPDSKGRRKVIPPGGNA